jgi:hypothetical protein
MNLSFWTILTIVAFVAVMVFASIAAVFVARLVRRPTLPISEQLGGIPTVLRKLRKREPMSDDELAVARQAVSDRGSFMALCIPAAIFSKPEEAAAAEAQGTAGRSVCAGLTGVVPPDSTAAIG